MSQIEKAKVFAELHVKGRPIILYNAWMRAALRPSRTPARRRPACSIRSFGNDEIRSEGLDCDTDKNTDRTDGCRGLLRAFSMHQEELSGKGGIELVL